MIEYNANAKIIMLFGFKKKVVDKVYDEMLHVYYDRKYEAYPFGVIEREQSFMEIRNLIRKMCERVNKTNNVIIFCVASDWAVLELNNMVLLSTLSKKGRIELGYVDDYAINPEHVEVYDIDEYEVRQIEVTKDGFEIPLVSYSIGQSSQDYQDIMFGPGQNEDDEN